LFKEELKMEKDSSTTRRNFIKAAALWGGLGTLLGSAKPAVAEPDRPLQKTHELRSGYRVTPQIKRYYETAGL
jgi:hypothetical protein